MSELIWYDYSPKYRWYNDKLFIIMKSGNEIPHNEIDPSIHFRVSSEILAHPSGAILERDLPDDLLVQVRPISVKIALYKQGKFEHKETIYPPSSGNWYARVEVGNQRAILISQRIQNSRKLWLTIIDYPSGKILESHTIFPYEAEALTPLSDLEMLLESDDEKRNNILSELLEQPPPTWPELYELCRGMEFPDLIITDTMGSTLEQLLPRWWSALVREEASAFLAILLRKRIDTDSDPIGFLGKFLPTPTLRSLLALHLKHLILETTPINWLQLFARVPDAYLSEMTASPFSIYGRPFLGAIYDIGGLDVLIKYILKLTRTNEIPRGLPITREQAMSSPQLKMERLYLNHWGLNIHGRVNTESIGLSRYYYIGKAHQWPHRHLAYVTVFNNPSSSQHRETLLHELVLPARAADIILQKRPNLMQLDWYVRHVNPKNAYNLSSAKSISIPRIVETLQKHVSPRYFRKRFKPLKSSQCSSLTDNDIRVMDALSSTLWLSDLEHPTIVGIPIDDFIGSLQNLKDQNVIATFYWGIHIPDLQGIIIIANAPEQTLLSVANGIFLNSGASSLLKIKDSNIGIIQGIFHKSLISQLCASLNEMAYELNIDLTASTVVTYHSYRSNLFSRLWKNGGWDDNVSNFLSQARMNW